MKTIATLLALVVALGWAPAAQAQAQQQAPTSQTQRPVRPPMRGGRMMAPGTMEHQAMMEMMCPMMMGMMMGRMMGQGGMGRGMMGAGMMGMGGGMMGGTSPSDPKAMARMLRFRGDMMKAIGDVMLKHAQEIEQEK